MFKKLTAIAILVISIPVMAYAGAWSLNTWARSAGGTISVNGGNGMRVTNGSQFANYTGGEVVAVTITPDAGYSVKYFIDQLGSTSTETADGTTAGIVNITSANASLTGSVASLWAVFHPSTLSVTASTDGNASVNLTNIPYITPGFVAPRNIVFDFTAKPGYTISSVTGASGSITTAIALNGNYAQVTIPAGYVFSAPLSFVETSAVTTTATSAIPNAGVPQVIANGATATLAGTTVGPAPTFTNWSCVSKPATATQPFAKASAQTATYTTPALTVSGTYVFQFRVSNTVSAKTSVTVNATVSQPLGDLAVGRTCQSCHTANGIGSNSAVYAGIYTNYSGSMHSRSTNSGCTACHYGTGTGGHPGSLNAGTVDPGTFVVLAGTQNVSEPGHAATPTTVTGSAAPGAIFCTACHTGAHPIPHSTALATTCANCHTRAPGNTTSTLDAHAVQDFTKVTMLDTECVNCHRQALTDAKYGTVWSAYSTSVHKKGQAFGSSCAGCHGGPHTATTHPTNGTFSLISSSNFITKVALAGGENTPTTVNAGAVFCTACHNVASGYPFPAHVSVALNPGVTCAGCHTDPVGQGNGTGDAHAIQTLPKCTDCHAVHQKQVNAGLVNDNNGVRQITGAGGEFKQWSHHVINDTNVNSATADPVDAQCVVCHMEGSYNATTGAVSVTTALHMNDGNIYLRDCNTALGQSKSDGTKFTWTPANPDHTAMDQFCMSCHNANGAVSAPQPKHALAGTPVDATALNPFGDLIQNNYDGLFRNAVVPVYDQFDPNNTSHHAVRAARYTANSADTTAAQAFNMYPTGPQAPAQVVATAGTFANISANNAAIGIKNLRYQNGASYVGTMADTGKFVTTYKALDGGNSAGPSGLKSLADNSKLHCGDCHTVGQWAARGTAAFQAYSTAYGPGVSTYYKQAIGAHGSGNEYMLRNSNGDNSLNPIALVCYNCHANTLYGSGGASTVTQNKFTIAGITPAGPLNGAAGAGAINPAVSWTMYNFTSASRKFDGNGYGYYMDYAAAQRIVTNPTYYKNNNAHDGVAGSLGAVHCNDDQNNSAGLTGLARLNTGGSTVNVFDSYTAGHYSSKGNGNAFGIKCANCHNGGGDASTNKAGYGGIHGNAFRQGNTTTVTMNATYQTYSSAGAVGSSPYAITTHNSYRFMPGLGNFRYNAGVNSGITNDLTMQSSSRTGCYTLNGSSTDNGPTKPKNGDAARYTGASYVADDTGIMGTWGACSFHSTSGDRPSRNVLRPTSY